jgi:CheY-like chemotaxis protein
MILQSVPRCFYCFAPKVTKSWQPLQQEEALSALTHHQISLIILDLNFSIETSGKEGMELLQKDKAGKAQLLLSSLSPVGEVSNLLCRE